MAGDGIGRLLECAREDKFERRVAELLNITDVVKDGQTMSDANGIVDLSILGLLQEEVNVILEYLNIDLYYCDENGEIYGDENGERYTPA